MSFPSTLCAGLARVARLALLVRKPIMNRLLMVCLHGALLFGSDHGTGFNAQYIQHYLRRGDEEG